MSEVIVDEQLGFERVVQPIQRWTTVRWIPHLRPGEHIDDDRIPVLLRELKQPTFITIDEDFWERRLRHTCYCIVYFALRDDQQDQIPHLLRQMFRLPQFNTRAKRMGKVIRVSAERIQFYQLGDENLYVVPWQQPPRQAARKRRRWR